MSGYGVYLVTGRRQYRGHEPGATFEAALDPSAEQRAVARGDITLLERVTPTLTPGSYTLRRWPPPARGEMQHQSTETPKGVSLI